MRTYAPIQDNPSRARCGLEMIAPARNAPACSAEELQKLCNTLALQHAEVARERDDFARQLASRPRSSVDAEKALLSIRQARDTLLTRNHELLGQLTLAEDRHAELEIQHEDQIRVHAATMAELQALRQEVEELKRDAPGNPGDQSSGADAERGLERATAEMDRQVASITEERDDALSRAAELEARAERCETEARAAAERVAAAEKERDTALEAAAASRRQIAELVADRDALQRQFKSEQAALHAQVAALHPLATLPPPEYAAAAAVPPKPLTRRDSGLAALHLRLAALEDDANPVESLDLLSKQLLALGLRSQSCGLVAAHRLATVAAEYATWLRKAPAKIPAALPSLAEALGVLDRLCAIEAPGQHPDPTGALVYAVDDDVDNCECITMAFEKISFQTKYAVKPEAALADFGAGPCDLVVLDVDMPGMSGFQLQKRIREIPHLRTTPIIFVSGHLAAAEQVAALGEELHRFVGKPYSLNELCLKALTLVIQSRLGTVSVHGI